MLASIVQGCRVAREGGAHIPAKGIAAIQREVLAQGVAREVPPHQQALQFGMAGEGNAER